MTLPTPNLEDFDPDEQRLAEVLDRYVSDRRAGKAVSHEEMIQLHPSLAMELRECLPSVDFLDSPSSDVNPELIKSLAEFEILETIGRGGMGIVYRARQKSLDREVALKVMRVGFADEEAMERFSREAMLTAALHHTNIVPIHAVGHADGVHFYAMQLIEGQSLAHVAASLRDADGLSASERHTYMGADDSLSVSERRTYMDIIGWGLQAAEALAHAHSRGVIHRDVKPSNLILDEGNRVWLTDFGLAKRMDDVNATITSAILGTPRYMSPEQASGVANPVDHRTDIYSLGATLYELLTGKPVFDGDSPLKIMDSIRSDEIVRPRDVQSDLPRDIDAVVMKCLERRPSDRYDSAEQLASDLRAITEERPVSVKPPSAIQQFARKAKTHRRDLTWATGIVATCALLFIAIAASMTHYARSNQAKLIIRSNAGPYSARILNQSSDDWQPSEAFTVPMQSADTVPAGPLEIRLTRSGLPSETVHVVASAGEERTVFFEPIAENRWTAPLTEQTIRPLTLDGKLSPIRFRNDSIAKLNLSDGSEMWSLDASAIKHEELRWSVRENPPRNNDQYNEARRAQLWQQATQRPLHWVLRTDTPPSGPLAFSQPPLMLDDSTDFDGDGHDDLIVTARDESALAAISGLDGSVIWAARYHFPADVMPPLQFTIPRPGFASLVRVSDMDDDGVDDLLCQPMRFTTPNDAVRGRSLVSGKTGAVIWATIDEKEFPSLYPPKSDQPANLAAMDWGSFNRPRPNAYHPGNRPDSILKFNRPVSQLLGKNGNMITVPLKPHVDPSLRDERSARVSERLAYMTDNAIEFVSLATGKLETTLPLSFAPATALRKLKTTRDGTPLNLAILVGTPAPLPPNRGLGRQFYPIPVAAINLDSQSILWTTEIHAEWTFRQSPLASSWPLIVDMDADGNDEIIVPSTVGNWEKKGIVELVVLDGLSGKEKIRTQPIPSSSPQIDLVTDVPDIDGDGSRDMVTATLFRVYGPRTCGDVHFDAFASSDGRHLWHREEVAFESDTPFDHFVTQIETIQQGSDHWIEVVLEQPAPYMDIARSRTLYLDPMTGRTLSDYVGLTPITPVDERDQRRLFLEDFPNPGYNVEDRLVALTEMGRAAWTILGGSGMVPIENGTNRDDTVVSIQAMGPHSVLQCLNQSGETLWTKSLAISAYPNTIRQIEIWKDRPTILFATPTPSRDGQPRLIDATTGDVIWQMQPTDTLPSRMIHVEATDLEGDGEPELLMIANELPDSGVWDMRANVTSRMYCVDATHGTVKWQRRMLEDLSVSNLPAMQDDSSSSSLQGASLSALAIADLNDDGINDVVTPDSHSDNRVLTAINGATGETLWLHPLFGSSDQYANGNVPRPILLRAKDGSPLIAVTDQAKDQAGVTDGLRVELKLIDGRSGKVTDTNTAIVGDDWKKSQNHNIWYHHGRFALHVLPGSHLGWLTRDSKQTLHYTTFDLGDGSLQQVGNFEVFSRKDDREANWLKCWLDASDESKPSLVSVTSRTATRFNTTSGEVLTKVNWETTLGTLSTVQGIDRRSGKTCVLGRTYQGLRNYVQIDKAWVAMDVDNGKIKWRLPLLDDYSGDPYGVGYKLLRRAGGLPPKIVLNNLKCQSVLATIASHSRVSPRLAEEPTSQRDAATWDDRRYIRNLPHLAGDESGVDRFVATLSAFPIGVGIFVIPFLYLRKLRRAFSLRYLLLAFPVVAITILTLNQSPPKMWSTYPSVLATMGYGFFGTALTVGLFQAVRSIVRRRWIAAVIAAAFVFTSVSVFVFWPIVSAKLDNPMLRFEIGWRNLFQPINIGLFAFGIACIIAYGIKGLWHVGVSLRDTFRQPVRLGETDLHKIP